MDHETATRRYRTVLTVSICIGLIQFACNVVSALSKYYHYELTWFPQVMLVIFIVELVCAIGLVIQGVKFLRSDLGDYPTGPNVLLFCIVLPLSCALDGFLLRESYIDYLEYLPLIS